MPEKTREKHNWLMLLSNAKCDIEPFSRVFLTLGNFLAFFLHFHMSWGVYVRGVCVQGVSIQGLSVPEGICLGVSVRGYMSRGVLSCHHSGSTFKVNP